MNRNPIKSHSQIALTAVLALISLGCQSDCGSRWQLKGHQPIFGQRRQQCQTQYARIQPGHSIDQPSPAYSEGDEGLQFGHSTDSGLQYAPEPVAEPAYPAPPAPPSLHSAPMPSLEQLPPRENPDIPRSQGNAPIIEEDVRLKSLPVPPHTEHVRDVGEPDRLSPFSVRSIYEKLRPSSNTSAEVEDGPIASRNILDSATRVVDFRNTTPARTNVQPVTLGRPEVGDSFSDDHETEVIPPVMQATPSAYRHPLMADPTGLPYGVIN